jgi:hypothetical protein
MSPITPSEAGAFTGVGNSSAGGGFSDLSADPVLEFSVVIISGDYY